MRQLIPVLILVFSYFLSNNLHSQSLVSAGGFNGASSKILEGTAVDAGGNFYTVGGFHGIVDFDPGPGTMNLVAPPPGIGGTDIFIVKQSAKGDLLWAKQIGGNGIDVARAVTVNPLGFVEIAGDFQGTVDFDPGNGITSLIAGGEGDAFILRLSGAGDFISVRHLSAPAGGAAAIRDITTDHDGNLVMAMNFGGALDFDPGPGVFTLTGANSDIAICKFSSDGNFSWAVAVANSATAIPNSVIVDQHNNIIYGGFFLSSMDFDPGAGVFNLTSAGGADGFVSKLDPQGAFTWARQFRNSDGCAVFSIASDADDNVYASGFFEGSGADFDPGPGTFFFNSNGDRDAFALKLSKDGNFGWASHFGSNASDQVEAIETGADGSVYMGLTFYTTIDMDPSPAVYNLNSRGKSDFALAKFNPLGQLSWVKQTGGPGFENIWFLRVDKLDNIYVIGKFEGTVDFDPGPDVVNLTATGVYPYSDIFTAKFSPANQVSGTTFQDNNDDGIKQSNEPPIANVVIKAVRDNLNYYAISDTNGSYRLEADTGSYVVTPGLPLFYTSVEPAIHNASFGSSFNQQDSANHFALVPSNNIKDLRVYITNLGPARQGRPTLYQVTYENKGTETISGSIELTFDNHLSFTSAAPAPDVYTLPVATWNFSNLAPSMVRNIIVECLVSVSAVPNSYLKTYVVANPVTGDFDPGNNIDSVYHLVVASFDPNDKKVIPDGGISADFIASRKYLDYTIRFQNTGNDTAFLVVVMDTLQSNLDVFSFEMLSASHPYSLRMYKDGIAEWRFWNILLPDSNVNEPRSHGFVRYRIRPKNTLVPGDMVKNKAAIYFDYNAPVITNETQNIVTMVTAIDPGPDPIEAKVFPNPTRSILYLRVEGYFQYWLYDVSGKKIGFSNKSYDEAAIDILRLRKGIYFLEIKTKKGKVTKKILVQ